jgi:bifunctional non-homologous end joining protein LigD
MTAKSVTVGGIRVDLSNTGKVLFPDDGITKGDLIEYYRDMAGRMLPYFRDRPVTMTRYPDGINGPRIVQKNVPDYFPGWVSRTEVKKEGGTLWHVLGDKPATFVYLANQACIELHVFLSRTDRLDHPDQLVVDLDPPGSGGFD